MNYKYIQTSIVAALASLVGCSADTLTTPSSAREDVGSDAVADNDATDVGSGAVANATDDDENVGSVAERASPAELQQCLNACKAGGSTIITYCGTMPTPQFRAMCYAAAAAGTVSCMGFCYARFVD